MGLVFADRLEVDTERTRLVLCIEMANFRGKLVYNVSMHLSGAKYTPGFNNSAYYPPSKRTVY